MYIISLISFKGGVGKTTSAVHIAAAAYEQGLRVLLIDLDFEGAATRRLVDPNYMAEHGVGEWLNREMEFDDVCLMLRPFDGDDRDGCIDVLPGTPYLKQAEIQLTMNGDSGRLINNLLDVQEAGVDYDLVVVDTHPADDRITTNAVGASDLVISPFSAEPDAFIGPRSTMERVAEIARQYRREIPVWLLPTRYSLKNGSASKELVEATVEQHGAWPEGIVLPHVVDSDVLKNTGAEGRTIYESRPGHTTGEQYTAIFNAIYA